MTLAGFILTLDAMGCQKTITQEIKEADADSVLALEGNQERCMAKSKLIWTPP